MVVTKINGQMVQVLKTGTLRMVLIDDNRTPYFMHWNREISKWQFVETAEFYEVRNIESELSDFIVTSEKMEVLQSIDVLN